MARSAFMAFACLLGCAQGGSGAIPPDAGKTVDAGDADVSIPIPCGGGGQGCCAHDACHAPFTCQEGLCGVGEADAGDSGGTCIFVECSGVCTDTMSDSTSCGECGHDCQGNFCAEGLCLATGIAVGMSPVQLAVDAVNVYFTDSGDGTVDAAPKAGGTLVPLVSGLASPYGIAVQGSLVYFTTQGTMATEFTDGAVLTVPVGGTDGGAPTAIATGRTKPQSIAVDGENVYWLEPGTSSDDGSILSCPPAGCPPNTPNVIYDMLALPVGLALDATSAYVTTSAGGQVVRFDKTTGANTVLAQMQNEPAGITAANGMIYWATMGDGLVQFLPVAGGTAMPVVATMGSPEVVAADAVNVYWSDANPVSTFGPVDSCVVGGCPPGNPVTLVSQTQMATWIAIDALFVYWIGAGGQILRVAK
jgi:hypothetical protein